MKKHVVHWSILAVAVLPAASVLSVPSHADVVLAEWIGPSPGTWSMAKRWSGGVVPWNTEFTRFQVSITDDGGAPSSVEIATGVPVIDTLALGASAQLSIAPGAGLEVVDGMISNDGTIVLEDVGAGSVSQLRLGAGETLLDGVGVITGNGLRARIRGTDQTSRLINGPTHVIRGSMWLGDSSGSQPQYLRLTNYGVIEANATGSLALGLRGDFDDEPVNVNAGVMRAVDGGILAIYKGGTIDNHGGIIEAGPGSIVRIGTPGSMTSAEYGEVTVRGGVVRDADGDGPGRIEVADGTLILRDGAVVDGAIHVIAHDQNTYLVVSDGTSMPEEIRLHGVAIGSPSAYLTNGDPVFLIENTKITGVGGLLGSWVGNRCVIAESVSMTGWFQIGFRYGVENHGRIEILQKGWLTFSGFEAVIVNHRSGVIRMAKPGYPAMGHSTWLSNFQNHGLVEIAHWRQITFSVGHSFYRQAEGTTVLHGRVILPSSGSLTVAGGALTGSGECVGFVNHAGGLIAPEGVDESPAAFTITGSLTQGSDAEVEIDVDDGPDSEASASDRILVSGHATLAGKLRIRLVDGFVPAPGDSFTVLTAGSIEGAFESIDSCLPVDVVYSAGSVSVVFTASSPADLNADGTVDGDDLSILLGSWGPCAAKCCLGDVDRDGEVCGTDLAFLLGAWGA